LSNKKIVINNYKYIKNLYIDVWWHHENKTIKQN
jgi:hypothetical protein